MPKMAPPPIPDGMIELMKQLSKSVLKEKPDNIYEHASKYFEQLLLERDGCLDKGYGKFRSYSEYCKFMKKMDAKRPIRLKHIQDESDSGIGSSNTDEESKNLNRKPHKQLPPDMEISGTAIQATARKTKAAAQPRKTKNYSINPKFKPQAGGVERDKKATARSMVTTKDRGDSDKGKVKPKQRKLSSKKPADCLIAITEETSVDVAEDNSDATKVKKSAAIIQRAFRAYLVNKALKMIETSQSETKESIKSGGMSEDRAAVIIQNLFKNLVQKKRDSVVMAEEYYENAENNLKEIEDQVIVPIDKSNYTEIETKFVVEESAEVENGDVQIVEEEIIVPVKVKPRHIEADLIEESKLECDPNIESENVVDEVKNESTEEVKAIEESEDVEKNLESENIAAGEESSSPVENIDENKNEKLSEEIFDSKIDSENIESVDELDTEEKNEQVKSKQNDDVVVSSQSESEVFPNISETEEEIQNSEFNHEDQLKSEIIKNSESEVEIKIPEFVSDNVENVNSDELKDEKMNNETVDSENVLENDFNEAVNEIIIDSNNLLEGYDNISQVIVNVKESVQDFLENEREQNFILTEEETVSKNVLNVEEMLKKLPSVPEDDVSETITDNAEVKIEQNTDDENVSSSAEKILEDTVIEPLSELGEQNDLEAEKVVQSEAEILLDTTNEQTEKQEENLNESHVPMAEEVILSNTASEIRIDPTDLDTNQHSQTFESNKEEEATEANKFEEILEQCITDEDINALASTRNGSIIKIHELNFENEKPLETEIDGFERQTKSLDIDIDATVIQPESENLKKPLEIEENYANESKDIAIPSMNNEEKSATVEENLNADEQTEMSSEPNSAKEIVKFCGTTENSENCQNTNKIHNEAENIFAEHTEENVNDSSMEKIVDALHQNTDNLLSDENIIEPSAPLLEEITTADETAAAINIQKSYRGYRARRDVKSKIEEQTPMLTESEIESNVEQSTNNLTSSNVSILVSSQDGLGDILTQEHKNQINTNLDLLSISNKHSIKPIEEVSETSDLSDRDSDHIEEPIKNEENPVSSVDDKENSENELIAKDYVQGSKEKSSMHKQISSDLSETEDISAEKFKESGVDETSRDERDDLSELDNFDFSSCGEDSLEAMYYSLRKNEILLDKMQRQAAEQRNSIAENSAEETNNEDQELLLEAIEMNKKLTEKIAEAEKSLSPIIEQHLDTLEKEKTVAEEAVVSLLSDDLSTVEDFTAINMGKVGKDFLIESDSATDNNDIVVGGTILESVDLTSSVDEKSLSGSARVFPQIHIKDFPKLLTDENSDNNIAENFKDSLESRNEIDASDINDEQILIENTKKIGDEHFLEMLNDDRKDLIDDHEDHDELAEESNQENETSDTISPTKELSKTFETLTQKEFPKLLSDDQTDTPTDNDDTNNDQNKMDEPISTVSESSAFDEKTSTAIDESSSANDMEITNPIAYAMKQQEKFLNVMHPSSHQSAMSMDDTASEELDEFPDYPSENQHLENIRRNILASSISEADSDYVAPSTATSKHLIKDDFNISTAFDHITSTDSDSTIISAATKIQAGARGFLTRRRLRRSSAGTSISADRHCSFGNAAIDKSLEDLLEQQELNNLDEAAVKIQRSYRNYMDRKKRSSIASTVAISSPTQTPPPPIQERSETLFQSDESGAGSDSSDPYGITEIKLEQKKLEQTSTSDDSNKNNDEHVQVSPADDDDIEQQHEYYKNIYVSDENSVQYDAHRQEIVNGTVNECQEKNSHHLSIMNFDELDTAQQRRMTLQRGDAVQRHSTPEEYDLMQQQNGSKAILNPNETTTNLGESDEENNVRSPATIMAEERKSVHRQLGPRQRSMPVQIDTEFLRLIPKHLRKRIKSAGSIKKKI